MLTEQHQCTKYLCSALRTNEPIEITYYEELPLTLRKIGYRELNTGIRVCVGKQRGHYTYFNGCLQQSWTLASFIEKVMLTKMLQLFFCLWKNAL